MDITDYFSLVSKRLSDAQAKGDTAECVRLLRRVVEVATEKANELEKSCAA